MNRKKGLPARIAVISLLAVLICILTLTAQARTSSSTKDENTVNTAAVYTNDILDTADITITEDDQVIRTDGDGCIALTIVRAYKVEIDYCGQIITTNCTGGTVAEAIEKAGITLTGTEKVTPDLESALTPDTTISIRTECGVTVTADGKTNTYNCTAGTVADLLSDLNIQVDSDDIVTPDPDTAISPDMKITVKRVEVKEETTTEVIKFKYESSETSSLTKGTSKVKQQGINGEKTVVKKNTYIDGKLTESTVVSEEVTKEAVAQITLVGTGKAASSSKPSTSSKPSSSASKPSSGNASVSNAAGTFVDNRGKTVSYSRVLTGKSTAYYSAPGALTATGKPAQFGGVAVNPNVIPYGSKLYIVSNDGKVYGYATAIDTGGALMSGRILVDVYYPTYNQCMNWGVRNVTVYVIG